MFKVFFELNFFLDGIKPSQTREMFVLKWALFIINANDVICLDYPKSGFTKQKFLDYALTPDPSKKKIIFDEWQLHLKSFSSGTLLREELDEQTVIQHRDYFHKILCLTDKANFKCYEQFIPSYRNYLSIEQKNFLSYILKDKDKGSVSPLNHYPDRNFTYINGHKTAWKEFVTRDLEFGNEMVIVYPDLFQHCEGFDTNLYEFIRSIEVDTLAITILYKFITDSDSITKNNDLQADILRKFVKPKYTFNFFRLHALNDVDDRCIYSNYFRLNTGHIFKSFDKGGRITSQSALPLSSISFGDVHYYALKTQRFLINQIDELSNYANEIKKYYNRGYTRRVLSVQEESIVECYENEYPGSSLATLIQI